MSSGPGPHSNGQPQQLVVRLLPPMLEQSDFCSQFAEYYPDQSSVAHMYYVQGENPRTPYEKPVYLRAYITFNLAAAFSSCQAALAGKPFLDVASNDSMVPQLQHGLFCKLWERPPPVDAEPQPLFSESRFFQHFQLLLPLELTNYNLRSAVKLLRPSNALKKKSKTATRDAKTGKAASNAHKDYPSSKDEQKPPKKSKKLRDREAQKANAKNTATKGKTEASKALSSESTSKLAPSKPSKKLAKKQRALEKARQNPGQNTPSSPAEKNSTRPPAIDGSPEYNNTPGALANGNTTKNPTELLTKSEKLTNADKKKGISKKDAPTKSGREKSDTAKSADSGKGLPTDGTDATTKKKRHRPRKPTRPPPSQT